MPVIKDQGVRNLSLLICIMLLAGTFIIFKITKQVRLILDSLLEATMTAEISNKAKVISKAGM